MADGWRERLGRSLRIEYPLLRQGIAEFLGTAILIALGDGCVAQSVLSYGNGGGILSINFGWMLAVVMAVYISGGVSGGHVNPAITLTMYILGRINLPQFIVYQIAQYLGAIFGASIVFAVYYEALTDYDGGVRQVIGPQGTAGIFSTYPQDFLTAGGGFGDQVGMIVLSIGISYGFNCGYSLNPARDLGPRIFTLVAGWGVKVFSYRDYNWFWVPWLVPYLGAVLGGCVYLLGVGLHWPVVDEERPVRTSRTPSIHQSLDVNVSDSRLTSTRLSLTGSEESTSAVSSMLYHQRQQERANGTMTLQGVAVALLYTTYQSIKHANSQL